MVDFPIRASIYRGFSIATFDYHRVVVPICKHDIGIYWVHSCKVMQSHAKSSIWHGHHGHWKSEVSHENGFVWKWWYPQNIQTFLGPSPKNPYWNGLIFVSKNILRHTGDTTWESPTISGRSWDRHRYPMDLGSLSFDWAAMTRV